MPEPVLPTTGALPLHDVAATRQVEQSAQLSLPPHALMAAAGLATARLALALAPHASTVWVAAGPGNNGGDGLVAARHLHQAGRRVLVSLVDRQPGLPSDAAHALQQAQAAGVSIEHGVAPAPSADFAIDALLGIGTSRPPKGELSWAIERLNHSGVPVLAIDLPSGLPADTGHPYSADVVRARHSLALLTLKPGLFTAQGRDCSGRIWFDDLGVGQSQASATAWLTGPPVMPPRQHAQHKGSFGDLVVIGGAPGMSGAATLAARAALAAGAGRVYLAPLDPSASAWDLQRPELMWRRLDAALDSAALNAATVVCGCGGGAAIQQSLAQVLRHAARLVLDADALNAIASDAALAQALRGRAGRGLPTVLTPHPLEAARLLACPTTQVQCDRLASARQLAAQCQAVVVLKGSGTVIAAPGRAPWINSTGNARLGSAGSGDVLAGWIGGLWAQQPADNGAAPACAASWLHGRAAEGGDLRMPMRAGDLIDAMVDAAVILS